MDDISLRKKEHLDLALSPDAVSNNGPGWDGVHLVAASIPKSDIGSVDTRVDLLGQTLQAPFVIASMTGGHPDATPINESLAAAAEEFGVAIGSGSQRAALRSPKLAKTYSVIRETAPSAVVMANLGMHQLIDQDDEPALTIDEVDTVIGMLDAQFLVIHLNALEEAIQPEGNTRTEGILEALHQLATTCSVPVIAKETGAGMSQETARDLIRAGVGGLDVGGSGGTSFARIEAQRAALQRDWSRERLGETFGAWGLDTVISVLEVSPMGVPVIATGGVRNGLHAAKALSLGAAVIGVGSPMLKAALNGSDAVGREVAQFIRELRLAAQLTGCVDMGELVAHQPVLTGHAREWAIQRDLQ